MKFRETKSDYNLYGNHRMHHPDGSFLFFCNNKKIYSYLRRNLATIVGVNDFGGIDAKFTFIPKASSEPHEIDKYPKANICVVSGVDYRLTSHHVIPEMFFKHYPYELKRYNSHDIVLLNRDKHYDYEINYARPFTDELANEYGILNMRDWYEQHKESIKPNKIAHLLLKNTKLPVERKTSYELEFTELTSCEPTPENLKYYQGLGVKQDIKYGQYFIEHVTDLNEFSQLWRQHFVDTMNPQFLPKGWTVKGVKYL